MTTDNFKGFKIEKETHNNKDIYIFKFGISFTDTEFIEYLALLDKLLFEKKTPFVMLIDTTLCKNIPVKASIMLINWMKKRKPDIPGILLGSSVVIKSSIIKKLINSVFAIQKPSTPNAIFLKYSEAHEFLLKLIS